MLRNETLLNPKEKPQEEKNTQCHCSWARVLCSVWGRSKACWSGRDGPRDSLGPTSAEMCLLRDHWAGLLVLSGAPWTPVLGEGCARTPGWEPPLGRCSPQDPRLSSLFRALSWAGPEANSRHPKAGASQKLGLQKGAAFIPAQAQVWICPLGWGPPSFTPGSAPVLAVGSQEQATGQRLSSHSLSSRRGLSGHCCHPRLLSPVLLRKQPAENLQPLG